MLINTCSNPLPTQYSKGGKSCLMHLQVHEVLRVTCSIHSSTQRPTEHPLRPRAAKLWISQQLTMPATHAAPAKHKTTTSKKEINLQHLQGAALGPRNERFPNKIQKGKCHSFLATRLQNNSTFVSQSILSSKSQVSMLSLSQPCLQIQFPLLDCSRNGLRLSSPCRRSSAFSGSTASTLMPSTPRPMVSAFGIPLRETIGERWSIHVTTTIQEIYDYIHV